VVGEYERLLRRMGEREMEGRKGREDGEVEDGDGGMNGDGDLGGARRERGKRKVIEEDSELEGTPEPKKAKEGAGG
ncbi:MAG: hypothetical protein Q9180_007504, partial [Flavoplaca navasiana]